MGKETKESQEKLFAAGTDQESKEEEERHRLEVQQKKERQEKKRRKKEKKKRKEEEERKKQREREAEEEQKRQEQERKAAAVAEVVGLARGEASEGARAPELPTLTNTSDPLLGQWGEDILEQSANEDAPDFVTTILENPPKPDPLEGFLLEPYQPTFLEQLGEAVHKKQQILGGEVQPTSEDEFKLLETKQKLQSKIMLTSIQSLDGSITTVGTIGSHSSPILEAELKVHKEKNESIHSETTSTEKSSNKRSSVLSLRPSRRTSTNSVVSPEKTRSTSPDKSHRKRSSVLSLRPSRRTSTNTAVSAEHKGRQRNSIISRRSTAASKQSAVSGLTLEQISGLGRTNVPGLEDVNLLQGLQESLSLAGDFSDEKEIGLPEKDEDVLSLALSTTWGQDVSQDWSHYSEGIVLQTAGMKSQAHQAFSTIKEGKSAEDKETEPENIRKGSNGTSCGRLELSDYATFHHIVTNEKNQPSNILIDFAALRRQQCKSDKYFCEQVQKYVGAHLFEKGEYNLSEICFLHVTNAHDDFDEEANTSLAQISAQRQDLEKTRLYLCKIKYDSMMSI